MENNELLMSDAEFHEAYNLIKNDVLRGKVPVETPVAIVLGGQPGAGKSNIYVVANERFNKNIVELDCDAFRVYHPYYDEIKLKYGKEDAEKTNPFVFKVVDTLVDELSDCKYNMIIESSLKTPHTAIENGENLSSKGYAVELQVMATSKHVSWKGTEDRYNEALKNGGSPRAVPKEFHDLVVNNICNSLNAVKASGLMSNIMIYDRNKECLYDMKRDSSVNPSVLLDAVINSDPMKIEKPVMFYTSLENINLIKENEYPYSVGFKEGRLVVSIDKSNKDAILGLLRDGMVKDAYFIEGVTSQQFDKIKQAGIASGYNPKSGILKIDKSDKSKVEKILSGSLKR